MSNYNINDEIDQLVDSLFEKMSITIKEKLKKSVAKSEKILLRQYVASQKETAKLKPTAKTDTASKNTTKKKPVTTKKKKLDYSSLSESDYSDSD
tara:strand:- start:1339 stop:1623 length:285 start_codon:yes stop_codon:yes gene_type:complete